MISYEKFISKYNTQLHSKYIDNPNYNTRMSMNEFIRREYKNYRIAHERNTSPIASPHYTHYGHFLLTDGNPAHMHFESRFDHAKIPETIRYFEDELYKKNQYIASLKKKIGIVYTPIEIIEQVKKFTTIKLLTLKKLNNGK